MGNNTSNIEYYDIRIQDSVYKPDSLFHNGYCDKFFWYDTTNNIYFICGIISSYYIEKPEERQVESNSKERNVIVSFRPMVSLSTCDGYNIFQSMKDIDGSDDYEKTTIKLVIRTSNIDILLKRFEEFDIIHKNLCYLYTFEYDKDKFSQLKNNLIDTSLSLTSSIINTIHGDTMIKYKPINDSNFNYDKPPVKYDRRILHICLINQKSVYGEIIKIHRSSEEIFHIVIKDIHKPDHKSHIDLFIRIMNANNEGSIYPLEYNIKLYNEHIKNGNKKIFHYITETHLSLIYSFKGDTPNRKMKRLYFISDINDINDVTDEYIKYNNEEPVKIIGTLNIVENLLITKFKWLNGYNVKELLINKKDIKNDLLSTQNCRLIIRTDCLEKMDMNNYYIFYGIIDHINFNTNTNYFVVAYYKEIHKT